MVGMVAKILFGNGAGLWKPDLGISNTRECVDLNFYRRGQEPRLTVHLLIVYSLPAEALVSTSFKAQNLIRSWLKKKKKDQKKKILGNDWRHSVYRLGFKRYWDIVNFLRCKSSIVVPWENLLIFRRYMLKYLEVKFYDACSLLWDGSEGRRRWSKKQTRQNVDNCWIQMREV